MRASSARLHVSKCSCVGEETGLVVLDYEPVGSGAEGEARKKKGIDMLFRNRWFSYDARIRASTTRHQHHHHNHNTTHILALPFDIEDWRCPVDQGPYVPAGDTAQCRAAKNNNCAKRKGETTMTPAL